MLAAADEFATGFRQPLMGARDLAAKADDALNHQHSLDRASDALEEARRRNDELEARAATVDLLFGSTSSAGRAASKGILSLRAWVADFEDWPPRDNARVLCGEADESYFAFNRRRVQRSSRMAGFSQRSGAGLTSVKLCEAPDCPALFLARSVRSIDMCRHADMQTCGSA